MSQPGNGESRMCGDAGFFIAIRLGGVENTLTQGRGDAQDQLQAVFEREGLPEFPRVYLTLWANAGDGPIQGSCIEKKTRWTLCPPASTASAKRAAVRLV